jgi:sulfotransferase family protein
MTTSSKATPELVLIVGAARSGTTLLRSLLDAHPKVGCPAETGLPGFISHSRRVWATVSSSENPLSGGNPLPAVVPTIDPAETMLPHQWWVERTLPTNVERAIRKSAEAVMTYYCGGNGATIYCDKSLDSGQHLSAVNRSFPGVRCIIMVRHVMDTIDSGLEASPWGFSAFGYAPFVHDSPENTVAALARYWEMQVSLAMRWQEDHPETCHLIRYEDLVADPSLTLTNLFEFLGVDVDLAVLEQGFAKYTGASGPGDFKLEYTDGINTKSLGRGKRVPVAMIPSALLVRLNELLTTLTYSPMTEQWNVEPKPANTASQAASRRLVQLLTELSDGEWEFEIDTIAIIADDDINLRWIVEPRSSTIRAGDGDVDLVITGATEDLIRMIEGRQNVGVLIRNGHIRKIAADTDLQRRTDIPRMITKLIARFVAA